MADQPRERRISIVFDQISDDEYAALANAMWAIVAAANADGRVYPDKAADLDDLNDKWDEYSQMVWEHEPDGDTPD